MKNNVKQQRKLKLIAMNKFFGSTVLAMLLFGCSVLHNGNVSSNETTEANNKNNPILNIEKACEVFSYSENDEPILVLEKWMTDLDWLPEYAKDVYMVEEWMLSIDGWSFPESNVLASENIAVENWMIDADFILIDNSYDYFKVIDKELSPWMLSLDEFFINVSLCDSIYFESYVAMDFLLF